MSDHPSNPVTGHHGVALLADVYPHADRYEPSVIRTRSTSVSVTVFGVILTSPIGKGLTAVDLPDGVDIATLTNISRSITISTIQSARSPSTGSST